MLVGPKIMKCSPVVGTTELDDLVTECNEINTECNGMNTERINHPNLVPRAFLRRELKFTEVTHDQRFIERSPFFTRTDHDSCNWPYSLQMVCRVLLRHTISRTKGW